MTNGYCILAGMAIALASCRLPAAEALRVGSFDVDVSPPIGSPLAYDPVKEVTTPLSCRGVVLLGASGAPPIVLCAIDWIGASNEGHSRFREALARAAKTSVERVAVHALHQHDAPWCDFTVEQMLAEHGLGGVTSDPVYGKEVIERTAQAVAEAIEKARPVSHMSLGKGRVERVASNRRILGRDGKVAHVRWTATTDPLVRAYPEGVVDPWVKLIAFWNGDEPIAALTFYATHPQSYYRVAQATPDFPGLARNDRQAATGVLHVHFCGAGGNIGAGKYNDGNRANRQTLADRMAAGMKLAWETAERTPIAAADLKWASTPVALPLSEGLDEASLIGEVRSPSIDPLARRNAASALAWLRRCRAGATIDIGCLSLKDARVLFMPGELFVEYQLAAEALRPDLFVAMAAYGDYSPWYIGTRIAYQQGGYETGPRASLVAPAVEDVLVGAMRKLLAATNEIGAGLGAEAAYEPHEPVIFEAASVDLSAMTTPTDGRVTIRLTDGRRAAIEIDGDVLRAAIASSEGKSFAPFREISRGVTLHGAKPAADGDIIVDATIVNATIGDATIVDGRKAIQIDPDWLLQTAPEPSE